MNQQRLIGAFQGDVATYEEVEHDEAATVEAAIIVAISAVLTGFGLAFTNGIFGGDDSPGFFRVFILGLIGALIGWVVWSGIVHFIGSRFFNAESTFGEMLRVIGYAHVVLWATVVPFVGWLAGFWFLWVSFKAIRAGLDIPTGPTLIVILIGFVIRIVISVLPGL